MDEPLGRIHLLHPGSFPPRFFQFERGRGAPFFLSTFSSLPLPSLSHSSLFLSLHSPPRRPNRIRNETVTTGEKEFDKIVKAHDFVVAEFYAPWCGHCKTLEPEYKKAAAELEKGDSGIKLVKVDATLEENKPLAERFAVKGFPTIKIFRGKDPSPAGAAEYGGPRDAAGIVSHLSKLAGPATKEVKDASAVAEAREASDVLVLGVFASAKDAAFKAFEAAADKAREDATFLHAFDASVAPAEAKGAAVTLFKKLDEPVVKFEDKEVSAEALAKWLDVSTEPKLPELGSDPRFKKVLQKVFSSEDPKLLAFVPADSKQSDAFRAALIALRESPAGEKVQVLLADPTANAGALQFFGLADADLPAFALHHPSANAKFLKKKVAPKDAKAFVAAFQGGKLVAHVKSEEPPKKNDGPVVVLTAKTFAKAVAGKGTTTLVKFYAPWCGHCKALVPIWEKLGETFKADKKTVIAKYDMTANDLPAGAKFEVRGFPTIVLFKDGGEHTIYSGDRTEDAIAEFVKAGGVLEKPAEGEVSKDEL